VRTRATVIILSLLLLAMWPAAATGADGTARLVRAPAKFPERAFVMTLSQKVEPRPGLVTVTENGVAVEDVALTPTNALGSIAPGTVLLIDTSNSMRGAPIANAIAAARSFATQRKDNQALAIITFNSDVRLRLPFTTDRELISDALSTTPPLAQNTRLFDAVDRALSLLGESRRSSSSIVVLSDGRDIGSTAAGDALVERAKRQSVRVFTVGLRSTQFDSALLQELAAHTGGSYSEAALPEDLAAIYDELGSRLANEYLVEYRSFARAGEDVKVRVEVVGAETATATYRSPKLPPAVVVTPGLERSPLDEVLQSRFTMILLALLLTVLVTAPIVMMVRPRSSGLRERLGAFVAVARPEDGGKRGTTMISERLLEETERSLGRMRWWAGFKEELEIAEVKLPAEQIIVLTTLGTVFLLWILSILTTATFALLGLLTPFAVRMYIRFRAERQRRAFGEQLPDNLQVLSAALRAGHSLIGALSVVVDDAPEPSRREFRQVVADEQLGVPLEEALTGVAARMRNRDLEQVALVAALQRETGGNSAEVLDRVADTVRERAALRRLVRTLTAQGRMARWIVSMLPVALLVIISVLNAQYMEPLFTKTAGQILLGFAALMVIAGSLVIRRIVNIKV